MWFIFRFETISPFTDAETSIMKIPYLSDRSWLLSCRSCRSVLNTVESSANTAVPGAQDLLPVLTSYNSWLFGINQRVLTNLLKSKKDMYDQIMITCALNIQIQHKIFTCLFVNRSINLQNKSKLPKGGFKGCWQPCSCRRQRDRRAR